ncbi:MAG: hypothetical protein L6R38_009595 [Xanthoria sp. 2 TBL-2021]|nr:MAG: hypothetical protein L6R38_009595 [Xanthoria sp. 2 TBL-2021]
MASNTGKSLPVRPLLRSVDRLISSVDTYSEGIGQVPRELCQLREELLALKGILQLLRAYSRYLKNTSNRLIVNSDVLQALSDHLQTAQDHLGGPIFPSRLRPLPPWPFPVNEHEQIVTRLAESRRCLETLITPSLYEKLLARALDFERDLLRKAFVWLASAVRPLTVTELVEAIIVQDGMYELGPADRLPRSTDVLDIGGSLFLCDSRTGQVNFAHSALRDYLFSQAIKTGPAASFALSEDECHRQILVSCLTYLQLDCFRTTTGPWPELREELETSLALDTYPLLKYCVMNWTKHVNTPSTDEMVPHHAPRLLQLADTRFLTSFIRCRRQLERGPKARRTRSAEAAYPDPISYAAAEGLYASVEALLAQRDDPGAPTECEIQLGSPLGAAVLANHFGITRLLINAGADVVACHPKNGNAIQIAAGLGFKDILRLLLDRADELQLDIDSPENNGEDSKRSVLMHLCSGTGDLDCAKILLSRDAGTTISHLELGEAIRNKHYELAQLLLGHGSICLRDGLDQWAWVRCLIMDQEERAVKLADYCLQQRVFHVNDRLGLGQTPLHWAAWEDNVKVVQLLLETGADPNAKNLPGIYRAAPSVDAKRLSDDTTFGNDIESAEDTPLHCAAYQASLPIIDLLLRYDADPHMPGSQRLTPVQNALFSRSEEVVDWAITNGADVNLLAVMDPPEDDNRRLDTPIRVAALNQRWNIVKLLLASGADPNIPASREPTVLFDAAAGDAPVEILELIAAVTTNIRAIIDRGPHSILEMPVVLGSAENVRFLLSIGANVERKISADCQKLLIGAAYRGHLAVVEALLAGGADVNAKNNNHGDTALMVAAQWPYRCRKLLTRHFHVEDDVRMYGPPYIKPKMGSGERTYKSAMQYLKDYASSLIHEDRQSDMSEKITGLILSARHERIAIIRTLIQAGADINATNKTGETALHEASISGSKAIVKVLLGYGADIYARDQRGLTPLGVVQEPSREVGRQGIIHLLAAMHQLAGDTGSWVAGRFVLD